LLAPHRGVGLPSGRARFPPLSLGIWSVRSAGSPETLRFPKNRGAEPEEATFGRVSGFMALCRRFGFFGTLPVSLWLALRAAVLRLAVSTGALPGTAALGLLVCPGPSYAPPCFHGFRVREVQWPAEARCSTLPSRGPAPASRVGPLMSNVSRLAIECVALVLCLGRCAFVRGHMKRPRKAVLSRCKLAAVA
jgi:hypothetical protein